LRSDWLVELVMAGEGHTLSVEVLTPEGEVFSGEVQQVSTRTTVGEIGILANHVPVLAALEPTELRLHVSESEVERYAQAHGWMQVFANHALLLVEEAIPPDQLEPARLRDQMQDAEQRLSESEEGSAAHDRAEKDRSRAEAFLALAEGS
jgi:F-type H+-transporting ATPase subunit epsilon